MRWFSRSIRNCWSYTSHAWPGFLRARSRTISAYFSSCGASTGNRSAYMAVNLINAVVHCSMVYIFLRFWLGTRLIVDFASSCKEKLVFVDVENVVLGSKEPKSMYWFFQIFFFILFETCWEIGVDIGSTYCGWVEPMFIPWNGVYCRSTKFWPKVLILSSSLEVDESSELEVESATWCCWSWPNWRFCMSVGAVAM